MNYIVTVSDRAATRAYLEIPVEANDPVEALLRTYLEVGFTCGRVIAGLTGQTNVGPIDLT
jgi:hypothetical protein